MFPLGKTHHMLAGVLSEARERDPLAAVANTAAQGALS